MPHSNEYMIVIQKEFAVNESCNNYLWISGLFADACVAATVSEFSPQLAYWEILFCCELNRSSVRNVTPSPRLQQPKTLTLQTRSPRKVIYYTTSFNWKMRCFELSWVTVGFYLVSVGISHCFLLSPNTSLIFSNFPKLKPSFSGPERNTGALNDSERKNITKM